MSLIETVYLSGEPFKIGFEHGAAKREMIQNFLADNFSRVNVIRHEKLTRDEIFEQVRKHAAIINEDLPEIAEEIRGLAEGAHISYEEALLLQTRREIIGYSSLDSGECTLFANYSNDEQIVAQNIDLNGAMAELGQVLQIKSLTQGIPDILMYSFAGLLGYMGLNSAGLAIGINFVLSNGWRPGVSSYLLVRHLLKYSNIEECLSELKRIRRSSSRSLTICDKSRLAIVEMTVDDLRVISAPTVCRTNHYLHPDFQEQDRMNIFSRNASILRLNKINQLIEADNWSASPDALFNILSDHSLYPVGLCAHAEGNIRRDETVASVILQPHSGSLFVRKGNPCQSQTQHFSILDR